MTLEDTFRRLRNPVPPPPERVRWKSRANRRPALPQPKRGVRFLNYPEIGYFRLKLYRRGPWVPAQIWSIDHEPGEPENLLDTGPILVAAIGDKEVDPLIVWERGITIDVAEYKWRVALREWAINWSPDQPEANPYQPVDLRRLPSLF